MPEEGVFVKEEEEEEVVVVVVEEEEEDITIVMAGEDVHSEALACLSIYGPVIEHTHSSLEYEVPSVEV